MATARPRRRRGNLNGRSGIGIDYAGDPAFDPSENVKALNEAAAKRQDDLRAAENQRQDDLRAEASKLHRVEMQALETIVDIYGRHATEMDALRSYYAKEIRDLDSKHYAAIRQIDVTAVQQLAVVTSTTAESLRSLVQSTASTIATSTANTFQLVIDRVAALEKTSYEGSGKSTGSAATWAAIFGAFVILTAVVGALAFFFGHNNAGAGLQIPPGYMLTPVTPQPAPR